MNINTSNTTDQADKPLTRIDVEKLLQIAGSSEKLNLSNKNLRGIDFKYMHLSRADLRGANLRGADLFNADLRGADLFNADLSNTNLSNTDLRDTDLRDADLSNTNLSGAYLSGANLSNTNLRYFNLRGAYLSGAYLSNTDLSNTDLSNFNLSGADLSNTNLFNTNLSNTNLSGANLRGANLSNTDLSNTDLRNTDLRNTNLRIADLRGADLRGANLRGADLRGANLRGADLFNADLFNADLSNTDLSNTDLNGANLNGAIGIILPEKTSTFRIHILEEPLTTHNLALVISAFNSLHTKCWLIMQNRFADLIMYTETHDPRFENEAPLIITKLTHNSPLEMKLNISLEGIANAFRIIIESVEKLGLTRRKTLAEIKEVEQKLAQQEEEVRAKHEYEDKMRYIELQNAVIESQNKLIKLRRNQLDFVKEAYALSPKVVKTLQPSIDEAIQEMAAPTLHEDIIKLVTSEGLKLIEPPKQQNLSSPKK